MLIVCNQVDINTKESLVKLLSCKDAILEIVHRRHRNPHHYTVKNVIANTTCTTKKE